MNLQEAYNFLNFWINKYTGAWYSPEELDDITDRGQISYYSDLQPKYATSQRVKDILSPFRNSYPFTTIDTPNGVITIPTNLNYLDLLDCYITIRVSGVIVQYFPIEMVNEDERIYRLNSQIDPVTITSPFGEFIGKGIIQLWPQQPNEGVVNFLRRPVKPNFVYTVISGRVIVYNNAASTQLEWRETDQNAILLKTLSSMGINLSDVEIQQYAQLKTEENFIGKNRT